MSANKPFHLEDRDTEELLIDENEIVEIGLTILTPKGREPRTVRLKYAPELVDRLLVEAGYEPAHVPESLRRAALDVAWCLKKGITDAEDIVVVTGRSLTVIHKSIRALNASALA